MATDTEIVLAINNILDDYIANKLTADETVVAVARCVFLSGDS